MLVRIEVYQDPYPGTMGVRLENILDVMQVHNSNIHTQIQIQRASLE